MTNSLHGIILLTQDRLSNLVYIPSKQGYEVHEEVVIKAIVETKNYQPLPQMVALDDYIFIGLNQREKSVVVRLDAPTSQVPQRLLANSLSKSFGRLGAIGTDGEHLLLAAEGSLILLDRHLKILDRVQLITQNWFDLENKNAHDILVHQNQVYLMNNLIFSTYIFQFTIDSEKKFHINRNFEIQDAYPHLDRQWINPQLDQWVVIQSSFRPGDYRQKAHIFSLAPERERITSQNLYPRFVNTESEGFKILHTTKIEPVWAIVSQSAECYLVKINSHNHRIRFDEKLQLEIAIRGSARTWLLLMREHYLFILNSTQEQVPGFLGLMREEVTNNLVIVDIQESPQIILRQNLPSDNTLILSFLPY
jgi:hypothetical protein